MNFVMSELSNQKSLVRVTNKNGRVEFEINQEAVKTTSEGIVIGDLYGYISDVNDIIVKIFGAKDKSELVGKHVLEFLVKEEKTRAVKNSLTSITNNQGMTQKYRIRLKSGEEAKLEVTTTLMKDEQGQNIGFIDFVRKTD